MRAPSVVTPDRVPAVLELLVSQPATVTEFLAIHSRRRSAMPYCVACEYGSPSRDCLRRQSQPVFACGRSAPLEDDLVALLISVGKTASVPPGTSLNLTVCTP